MTVREWILSALFAAFVVLKLAEGWLALESWPLSHVPMFAERQPAGTRPIKLAVLALRDDGWVEMQPIQFGLNGAELNRRLLRDPDPAAACGELVRVFNARRPPARRIRAAYVRKLTLARPGSDAHDEEQRTDCPLAEENG